MKKPRTSQKKAGQGVTRRKFLAAGATAATVFSVVPSHVLGKGGEKPPSEKLNIAGIGVGGIGFNNLKNCCDENIVALCDVDQKRFRRAAGLYPKAKQYKDYRVMLEKQKDIDAVVIATPDHTHAVITLASIQAGKHVYCQKPLTHTVYEARKITEAAKASKHREYVDLARKEMTPVK